MKLSFKCEKSELSTAIERVCEIKNISIESDEEVVCAIDLLLLTMKAKKIYTELAEPLYACKSELQGENLTIQLSSECFEDDDDEKRETTAKMKFIQIVKCLQKEILNPKTE